MKKKISKKLLSPADKRETFIGAKVTAQQKEQIKELAKDKGMNDCKRLPACPCSQLRT